ncbi:MAG: hypothetical protein CM1200mP2_32150 [Planctomycetaceae bacterium]|nr:MAG: hypothetical protein CM1200mP2_32150 [Planctomycetaceae bacterium]
MQQRVVEGDVSAGANLSEMASTSAIAFRRTSTTIRSVPALAACLMKVAATGWLAVVLEPVTSATSARATSAKTLVTAPDPMVSISAATLDAWHSRVQ